MSTSTSEPSAADLAADYFDGRSSRRHAVTLAVAGGVLRVEGGLVRRSEPLAAIEVSEPMGDAPRTLRFADGTFCEVRDRAGLAALLTAAGRSESAVVRIQARWRWALAALGGMVACVAAAYIWALPWLARTIAPALPAAFSRAVSEAALQSLDGRLLTPSKLPQERRQAIADRVAALGAVPPHRLLFRAAPVIGANAFALPNGDVVILDELIALAGDDAEIAAIAAHELGHVAHHHGMRQLLQSAVVSFVLGAYFGDVSSVAASLGALVLESRYSREFELEADAYAARLLLAASGSAEPLARIIGRLDAVAARRAASGPRSEGPEVLSTHPDTARRIAALRALAPPQGR